MKMVMLGIIAVLAFAAIAVVLLIRFRAQPPQASPDNPGQRLLAHSRDRNDYRMFVGVPPAHPTAWTEVSRIDDVSVTLRDAQVVRLSDVTAYVVAYPGGTLVDYRSPNQLPLPQWAKRMDDSGPADQDRLTPADLTKGQALLRVEYGGSTAHPNSRDHYSTTLTNISGKRIRVLKFAGYRKVGGAFALSTITSKFFSAADFREWYGLRGEWIEPGQSVADPNNYGTPPVLWAYYCEVEGGGPFITGGILE